MYTYICASIDVVIYIGGCVYVHACEDRQRMTVRESLRMYLIWIFFLTGSSLSPLRRVLNPKFLSLSVGLPLFLGWLSSSGHIQAALHSVHWVQKFYSSCHVASPWASKLEVLRGQRLCLGLSLSLTHCQVSRINTVLGTQRVPNKYLWNGEHQLRLFPAQNTMTQHHWLLLEVFATQTTVGKPELTSTSSILG